MEKIVIIQCAGSKTQSFWRYGNQRIIFVANSKHYRERFPASGPTPFEPDDQVPGSSVTWRQIFLDYHQHKKKPDILRDADELPEAWKLYSDPTYQILFEKFKSNFYILSAGWGLVRADFRLPPYDITFSSANNTPAHAKISSIRLLSKLKPFGYNPLHSVVGKESMIYFFGGAKYRALLYYYTDCIPGTKVIYYRSNEKPRERSMSEGYRFTNYTPQNPQKRTNWQYECARRFTNGEL